MQVCIDQTKNSHRTVFSLIVWSKKKKKEGVSPEHDVTPMASDHLPLRLARLFLIFPSQLVKNKKKTRDPIMMSSRDLSLLRRALRYKRDMGEVSCGFFCVWACVRVIGVQAKNPIFFIKKKNFSIDRYSVTGIGYRWNSDKRYNGWPIDNKPTTD